MLSQRPSSARPLVPELVRIPGGEFIMGNDSGRDDERPAHRVRLRSFRAAVSPVTNAEYACFIEAKGAAPLKFSDDPRFNAADQPAVGVSWFEAVAYCVWLTGETGIPCRLPTEAERELATLGGLTRADWPWGGSNVERHPLYAELCVLQRPHVPRPGCANGYGLRCLAENVHEWCSDWYDRRYYAASPIKSPAGPPSGRRRASRGGAWRHQIKFNRVSARSSLDPSFQYNDYGFRVYADV